KMWLPCSAVSQALQLGEGVLGIFTICDGSGKIARAIKQDNRCGVIHGVVAAFKIDLLPIDAERACHLQYLVRLAADAENSWGNVDDIGVDGYRRIALRVDGDEIGVDLVAVSAEFVQPVVQFVERCRADFGAVGEAEED